MNRNLPQKTLVSLGAASLFCLLLASFALAAPAKSMRSVPQNTLNPHHQVTFATSGLPDGISITITGTRTHQTKTRDYSITFASPGPIRAVNTPPGSEFTYTGFPDTVDLGGPIYQLSGSSPASPFTTGPGGSNTAVVATYVVCSPVSITQQPVNLTEELDQSATFSVAISGPLPKYQWQKDGADIPGENSSTYTIPAIDFGDEGDYRVVVSNGCSLQTSESAHLSVALKSQAITFPQPASPKTYGDSFSVSASASSGLSVAFEVNGGCSLSGTTVTITSGVENCDITAAQIGGGKYTAAQSIGHTVEVEKAPLTVTAKDKSKVYGAALPTFDASIMGFMPDEDETTLGGALACGTAATATSPVSGSPYPITCSGLTSTNYAVAYVSGSLKVTKADQLITFDPPASPQGYATQFSVNPTADSGLAVQVEATGVCNYDSGKVTMTDSAGTCTLEASQPGDGNYTPALVVSRSVEATRADQTIQFPQPPSRAKIGASFQIAPTATSGLPVSLVAEGACTLQGSMVTLADEVGTCKLTASQAGNEFYYPAADVFRSVEVVINDKLVFLPILFHR